MQFAPSQHDVNLILTAPTLSAFYAKQLYNLFYMSVALPVFNCVFGS